MTILQDQISFYKSVYVNDGLSNGGRISNTLITDNSLDNLFRNIQSAERTSGITLYRKMFIKNENPENISLENPRVFIENVNSGEDYYQIALGTYQDNQVDAIVVTDWHGSGRLLNSLSSGESSFSVLCKQASGYPSTGSVIISDGLQQAECVLLNAPSWNGTEVSLVISGEVGLNFAADSIVSAVLPISELKPAIAYWTETSVSGVFDDDIYPVTLFNIGTVDESWTITFLNATTFNVTGASIGSLGSGLISANFAPVNGSSYYFSIDKNAWSGSWIAGDVITFNTVQAAQGIWIKESVPVGSGSQANNLCQLGIIGESA